MGRSKSIGVYTTSINRSSKYALKDKKKQILNLIERKKKQRHAFINKNNNSENKRHYKDNVKDRLKNNPPVYNDTRARHETNSTLYHRFDRKDTSSIDNRTRLDQKTGRESYRHSPVSVSAMTTPFHTNVPVSATKNQPHVPVPVSATKNPPHAHAPASTTETPLHEFLSQSKSSDREYMLDESSPLDRNQHMFSTKRDDNDEDYDDNDMNENNTDTYTTDVGIASDEDMDVMGDDTDTMNTMDTNDDVMDAGEIDDVMDVSDVDRSFKPTGFIDFVRFARNTGNDTNESESNEDHYSTWNSLKPAKISKKRKNVKKKSKTNTTKQRKKSQLSRPPKKRDKSVTFAGNNEYIPSSKVLHKIIEYKLGTKYNIVEIRRTLAKSRNGNKESKVHVLVSIKPTGNMIGMGGIWNMTKHKIHLKKIGTYLPMNWKYAHRHGSWKKYDVVWPIKNNKNSHSL